MSHSSIMFLRCKGVVGTFLFLLTQASAQTIVNTETLLLDGVAPFHWTAGASGDFSIGNSDVVDLTLDGGFAWTSGKWRLKASAAWAKLAEDGEDIQSSAFGQLRVLWGEATTLQPFLFVQTSQNNVFLMSQRKLWGAGVKRRVVNGSLMFLDASLGAFTEHELYVNEALEPPQKMVRNSLILSFGADLAEEVLFRMTTFVQTSFEDLRDSRVFLECALNATITDKVSLEWSSGLRWDSQPHSDLGTWDLGNTVGLRFGLNQDE